MEEWQNLVYLVTHILLVFEYLGMTTCTSIVLCTIAKSAAIYSSPCKFKVIFLVFIIFGSVGRLVEWSILSLVFAGKIILSNTWGNFITIVPTFFFLIAYFSLLLEWFLMYITIKNVTSNRGDARKAKLSLIFFFFVFFVLFFTVFFILGTFSIEDGIQPPATITYVGNIYEQTSILFICCGLLLIKEFQTNLLIVGEQHSKVRWRMVFIVFLVPSVFLLRAFLTSFDSTINISEVVWFDWAYYTFFEIAPLSFVVLMCRKSSKWEDAAAQ